MGPKTEEQIKRRAHEIWESEGRPHGRHDEHWRRAEQESGADTQAATNGTVTSLPGMLGDGTEEQNLNQPGRPQARITKDDVDAAFTKSAEPKKSK